MDHLETFWAKKFFSKNFWIIHKFWPTLVDFCQLWGQISPDWLKLLASGLLRLLYIHFVSLLTKFHQNLQSGWQENVPKILKKCMKIGHFRVKFSPWRRKLGKNLMRRTGKEIYRRFWISNQIFSSIYRSWDMGLSLDTTFAIFGQNLNFVDEYLENGNFFGHAVFARCSELISSTFWPSFIKIVRAVFEKKSKNLHFDHIFVLYGWTRIFSEKRLGAFLTLIVRNLHAKNEENR